MRNIFCLIILISTILHAQDLTGRWVAVTGYESGYYAELYLIQNSDGVYAGHCYDTEAGGFCRHWLDGKFNEESQEFYGLDMELINKSPEHSPTDYILQYEKGENGKEYLVGSSITIPYNLRQNIFQLPPKQNLLEFRFQYNLIPNTVRYVKVSDDYKMYNDEMPLAMTNEQILLEKAAFPEVFEEEELAKLEQEMHKQEQEFYGSIPDTFNFPEIFSIPDPIEILPKRNKTTEQDSAKINPPVIAETEVETTENQTEETVENSVSNPLENSQATNPEVVDNTPKKPTILDKRLERVDQLLAHVRLKTQKVTLLIRDYGTIDNDTVTIFYNNEIIAESMRITSNAKEFELEIDPNKRNELVFVANNLGDIAPNTARITLISNDKRYNYKLFTDEKNNALILLENIAVKEEEYE